MRTIQAIRIQIDNFETGAMSTDSSAELGRMLRDLGTYLESNSVIDADGRAMLDSNNERVGALFVDWDEVLDTESKLDIGRVEQFSMSECYEWLRDADVAIEDMPLPNPWALNHEGLLNEVGGMPDESEEELRDRLIEEIEDGIINGLDQWRQACLDNGSD